MSLKIDISNNLKKFGIPAGYKLVSKDEYLKNGGIKWLKSLKSTTPVLRDSNGDTGSRIWWCYSVDVENIEAINIKTLETRTCRSMPKSMMAVLVKP